MQRSEQEKIRKRNCQGEAIYRSYKDQFYPIPEPRHLVRGAYPWEIESKLPKITKEFFRCKGSAHHPPMMSVQGEARTPLLDCEGGLRHGLSLVHGKEDVYPILIDLLNYVQKKTGKRVVITSGHRCRLHHLYVEMGKARRLSKHQAGAEVDFYIQGMEDRPLEVVGILMQYYQEMASYQNCKEYQAFDRFTQSDLEIQPWMNKEILIQLYQKEEGRNFDNRHPHPYIAIQVRFDRDKNEKVPYH